jgi:hypothetical protein
VKSIVLLYSRHDPHVSQWSQLFFCILVTNLMYASEVNSSSVFSSRTSCKPVKSKEYRRIIDFTGIHEVRDENTEELLTSLAYMRFVTRIQKNYWLHWLTWGSWREYRKTIDFTGLHEDRDENTEELLTSLEYFFCILVTNLMYASEVNSSSVFSSRTSCNPVKSIVLLYSRHEPHVIQWSQ